MRESLVALASGALFAVGLGVAGMTQPGKVTAFLDLTGAWDPSLLFVMVGAIAVYLIYYLHWEPTTDAGLKLAVFCTGPAIRNPLWNLVTEILATFMLVFVAGAIFSSTVGIGGTAGLGPLAVGGLIWGLGLSLGGPTGYALNPARDLGPRIAHAILPIPGKGDSDWGYSWIPVVGPIIGASLAMIVRMAIGL